MFVSEKLAAAAADVEAVTKYVPALPLATTMGDVACPFAPVIAVATVEPLSVALAPLDGAVNVTVAPDTGLLPTSVTVATRRLAKEVFTGVLCPLPLVAVMTVATWFKVT